MFDDVSCSHIWLSGRRQWLHPRRSDITSAGEFTESPGSPADPTPVSLSTVLLASALLIIALGTFRFYTEYVYVASCGAPAWSPFSQIPTQAGLGHS